MKPPVKPWPLTTTNGMKERINTNPDYQRPPVWTRSQKQLLIDTILRDYDIPKLYWRKVGSKPDKYDVVDGQQRLRAIWSFFNNEFALPKDTDPVEEYPIANCYYKDLPDELRMRFDIYPLDVVVLDELEEDEVREMFLRLQNGTSLKAQERRNAYPGKMRDFVHAMACHPFFNKVGFKNSRYTYDLIVAQVVCLEIAGGPSNVKDSDLNKMYENNIQFDDKSDLAKSVKRNFDLLNILFPDKTPELERFNVISLYCVLNELQQEYAFGQIKDKLYAWFIEFEKQRRDNEALPEDQADPEWVTYKDKISHSTDSEDSIKWRVEFMLRNILEKNPTLARKDNQRNFTYIQKLTIFRKDKSLCQVKIKCEGKKVTWDDWHCDHKKPWSNGGLTTVENGQVSCLDCNLTKGAKDDED
jgi:hypothetical protein